MDNKLKKRLFSNLEEEASYIMRSDAKISEKIERMNDVINLTKIIENYEELEPLLKKYFEDKAKKEKWNNDGR